MKSLISQIVLFLHQRPSKRNLHLLLRFVILLCVVILFYSILFHYLMAHEGREHSWLTGLYWTLTVMTTLGFGDVTFQSDLGRMFSLVVLLSGVLFLMVLLPFIFIQFFYAPWMEAQSAARAPRMLPQRTSDHIILTNYDPVTQGLIARFRQYGYDYVLVVPDLTEALRLHDMGMRVMVGDLDAPETYRRCLADQAALVATTAGDALNTNIAFTVREVAPEVPLVATADEPRSAPILGLAGCTHVLQLSELMGEALARRTVGGDAISHVIGNLDELLIAEANASRTPLVGKTIAENRLGDLGVTVVGVWSRGRFEPARQETVIGPNAVLVLAGSRQQLDSYDEAFMIYNVSGEPVVVIGAGRIGRATARALAERGIDCRIIDQRSDRASDPRVIVGDAADVEVLRQAGIDKAPAVLITTRDDATNIYLTILLRHLRPDIQIISCATLERNVSTLHRAGADAVMSTASMGVSRIINFLEHAHILPIAEGLNIVRMKIPPALAGHTLVETAVRRNTGVTIVAVIRDGHMHINPDPNEPLPADADILLIGTREGENRFLALYGPHDA